MMTEDTASGNYIELFQLKGFSQLAVGTLLARVGAQFWQVALILFILQRYHSAGLAGIATFLIVAPGLVVSPLAGALLDRHQRMRLILADYGVAASSLALIGVLLLLNLLSPGVILIIAMVSSLTNPLSETGLRTLFPLLVPRDYWDRANAVDSAILAIATILGPAFAGFSIALAGGEGTFWIGAATFVATGLTVWGIRFPQVASASTERLLTSAGQSLIYVIKNKVLRGIIFALWITNIPYGILTIAVPAYVLQRLHWGTASVGILWSVAGVATVVAGIIAGRVNTEGHERRMLVTGLILGAIGCICIVTESPILLVIGMAFFGASFGPMDVGLSALRQRNTEPEWYGRVFAVSMSLNFVAMPIGAAIAGIVAQQSVMAALALAAGVAAAGCIVPFVALPRGSK